MSTKFKVGDIVKCIDANFGLTLGAEYEVTRIWPPGTEQFSKGLISVRSVASGQPPMYGDRFDGRFELVGCSDGHEVVRDIWL